MSPPRVRFTVRRLMVAVAVVAVALGAVTEAGNRRAANERRAAAHLIAGKRAMREYWDAYSEVSNCLERARSARSRQSRLEAAVAAARDDPAGARALRAAAERAAAEAERWDRAGVAPLHAVAESSRAARDAFGRAEACRRRWW